MPLSTNWNKTGDWYVCEKSGNDLNAGTKIAPFKTVNKAKDVAINDQKIIIRSGNYTSEPFIFNTTKRLEFIGDSYFIVGENNAVNICDGYKISGILYAQNINPASIGNGIRVGQNVQDTVNSISDSLLSGAVVSPQITNKVTLYKSIIICGLGGLNPLNTTISYTSIISSLVEYRNDFATPANFVNTLIYDTSIVKLDHIDLSYCAVTFTNTAFYDVSILGIDLLSLIPVGFSLSIGELYEANEVFNCSVALGGTTFNFVNCFHTSSSLFLAPLSFDFNYVLSPKSPLVRPDLSGGIIGNGAPSVLFLANGEAFNTARAGVTLISCTRNVTTGQITLNVGQTTATATSTSDILYAFKMPFLCSINKTSLSEFLYDFVVGKKWNDRINYNAGDASPNVRLTYRVAFYDDLTATWGAFIDFEDNNNFAIDTNAKGNGDPDFLYASLGATQQVRIFRLEITLRSNGV